MVPGGEKTEPVAMATDGGKEKLVDVPGPPASEWCVDGVVEVDAAKEGDGGIGKGNWIRARAESEASDADRGWWEEGDWA